MLATCLMVGEKTCVVLTRMDVLLKVAVVALTLLAAIVLVTRNVQF